MVDVQRREYKGVQRGTETRGEGMSHRTGYGSPEGGDVMIAQKNLEDRIRAHEVEIEELRARVGTLKDVLDSRDEQLGRLKNEVKVKDVHIRDAKQQIKTLEKKHAESNVMRQKYVAEARLSRDEEVSRLEEELEAVKKEHSEREKDLEREYTDRLASLEGSIDAIKDINTQLRQENESLQSNMKRAEARARDAERETQRAVNRFEAAIKSLEQLEHQYTLLEQDSKETEEIKTQRILALEQEVEDLRVSKSHALHEAQRDNLRLNQKLEEYVQSLEHAEKRHRKAELSAAESLHNEKTMESKLEHVQTLHDNILSENRKLQDDVAKARGEIERLKGSLDGTSSVSKSMQEMLKTYERDNASLVEELNSIRSRIRVAEGEIREKSENIDMMKKEGSIFEEEMRNRTNAALAGKAAIEKELEALQGETRTKERLWHAEKSSLTRELEVLHAKLEVLSQRSPVRQSNITDGVPSTQPEVPLSNVDEETGASFSEEAKSISLGDHIDREENLGEFSPKLPDHFKTPTASQTKQDLRDQLTALKLSILDSTSRYSGTKERLNSITDERGYLQSYRPAASNDDVSEESGTSSSTEDAEDCDALSRARHQVSRAKQYLSRMSTIES